jgi:SAM-dependent methyltransferase
MIDPRISDVQASYDLVADEYTRRIFDELEHKPLDRRLLDRFAARMQSLGPACDLGCGPGHVARYLQERGVQVVGIDLSPAMVSHARELNPAIEFRQGDMRSLEVEDGAWGGIVAFYSLIHIPPLEIVEVLAELRRILRPGGLLLLAFHIGEEVLHLDEWWGRQVSLDFIFSRPEEVVGFLESAGFQVEEVVEREPYPGVEHPSRRAYIFAEKPRGEDRATVEISANVSLGERGPAPSIG